MVLLTKTIGVNDPLAPMNAAKTHLQSLVKEICSQSPPTLAKWRLSYPPLMQALEAFAAAEEEKGALLSETQHLFDIINPLLAEQEQSVDAFPSSAAAPSSSHLAVVFGGKYAASPRSISELLVKKLVATCPHVFTVSRSHIPDTPMNVTHFQKQHLDQETIGGEEFSQVLQSAISKWTDDQELIIYFTLGQHKGHNPFQRNLQAATNLAQALKTIKKLQERKDWKVVLTGTDATLPSTHPDGKLRLTIDGKSVEYLVPTYKIMKYNYTYAMSKLGQYYIVAQAISQIIGKEPMATEECKPVIDMIQRHVLAAGEDGDYHPEQQPILSMPELDAISEKVDSLLARLDQLTIAQGISICYTPLHARPWTEQALSSSENSKGFVLEQIVRRFKNTISMEQAVACHFR